MKRFGYLIEDIAEMKNLTLAFYKAAKGKFMSPDVIAYRDDLHYNLNTLRDQILTGDVSVGKYHYFKIFDPKERLICAAAFDERVLHHAIMNVCHPIFEKHLIYDTYATRINKGVYKALERAVTNMPKYQYVAKLDVRKYFDSIDHDILVNKLARLFKDNRLLLIFEKIIRSYDSGIANGVSGTRSNKGVPIGNLTSQYFANHYLSETDHFIKETLRVPFYVRYMDDMLLMDTDKNLLKQQLRTIDTHLPKIGLQLKPVVLNKTPNGISFLGYKIFPHKTMLNKRSKRRFKAKTILYENNLNEGIWNESEYKNHIIPLWSFAQHAYTKRLRKEILEGSNRVLRGGSWNNNARNCRVSNRNNNNGFRLSLAQNAVSDDLLVNRESSCVSVTETENEQLITAQYAMSVAFRSGCRKLRVFLIDSSVNIGTGRAADCGPEKVLSFHGRGELREHNPLVGKD